ncbi:MAG: S8 family serine peptidase [Bacteroidota bacterium]
MRIGIGQCVCTALLGVLVQLPGSAGGTIGPLLEARMKEGDPGTTHLVWVFFRDKGPLEAHPVFAGEGLVSRRSLLRRAKVMPPECLTDRADLPVHAPYVDALRPLTGWVKHPSRWLNAVSVVATSDQIRSISRLPFVRTLEPVGRYGRRTPPVEGAGDEAGSVAPDTVLNYGDSFNQLNQIGVPAVHATGNLGQGVLVGVFDNGVRLLTHEAFSSMQILATHDFVDHKVSVVPNNPSSAFGSHGVNTLSIIGGNKPGKLIGPALGATFLLARTENDSSETPVEEDNWVAAIEWADSIGVDVTSTSLGYLGYNPPYPGWTWQNMDGNTTVITRAADMAVARGICVFNSAGNEGNNPSHNTLVAPADGDSVMAVGGLNPNGTRWASSSVGPTSGAIPRIKPDVMAQASGVWYASSTNPAGYGNFSAGTSFACPLAAGAAALILHARPGATPMQVAQAMKATAGNAGSPNNLTGWGTVNTPAAIAYLTAGEAPPEEEPDAFRLGPNYPNPFNPTTTIEYVIPHTSAVSLRIYDMLGREVRTLVDETQGPSRYRILWNGTDDLGRGVASGVYLSRLTASPIGAGGGRSLSFSESRTMVLLK